MLTLSTFLYIDEKIIIFFQLQHSWIATFMAFLVSLITIGLTYCVFSHAGVVVYLVQVLVISLVCPYWFIRLQYLKR